MTAETASDTPQETICGPYGVTVDTCPSPPPTPVEKRASTLARKALRRLAGSEIPGLQVGLDAADEAAVELGELMPGMRRTAQREAAARESRGLAGPGPFELAFLGARRLLISCIVFVESTETTADQRSRA